MFRILAAFIGMESQVLDLVSMQGILRIVIGPAEPSAVLLFHIINLTSKISFAVKMDGKPAGNVIFPEFIRSACVILSDRQYCLLRIVSKKYFHAIAVFQTEISKELLSFVTGNAGKRYCFIFTDKSLVFGGILEIFRF